MSILNYFSRVKKSSTSTGLPDTNGPLCGKVPLSSIQAANARVSKIVESQSVAAGGTLSRSRKPYLYMTPGQRFQIGKRAAHHGVTASIRYFKRKYHDLRLTETTVRRLKHLYLDKVPELEEQNSKDSSDDETPEEVQTLPRKKQGRPLLIGDELDKEIQAYIKHMREASSAVNTEVVIAAAEGILMNHDSKSKIQLTTAWAKYLLKRMGYVKRRATTSGKETVEDFESLKEEFLLEVKNTVCMDEIPGDMIVNFDQTGIHYIPVMPWTMEKEGVKRVEIIAKDDKRQITAVFAGTYTGNFLPPQVIYQGKTPRCLPQYEFPPQWNITYTENHWSNERP